VSANTWYSTIKMSSPNAINRHYTLGVRRLATTPFVAVVLGNAMTDPGRNAIAHAIAKIVAAVRRFHCT